LTRISRISYTYCPNSWSRICRRKWKHPNYYWKVITKGSMIFIIMI